MKEHDLDEISLQIINILQRNARITIHDIAKEINLSAPAVSKRIEKLEQEKYILGYHATVNPIALGLMTKAFISLEVTPTEKKIFYPFVKKCKNVIECNCVTGDYSMLLEVLFQNTMELDQFIGELQSFGRTKTLIVFSTSVEHRGIELESTSPYTVEYVGK